MFIIKLLITTHLQVRNKKEEEENWTFETKEIP